MPIYVFECQNCGKVYEELTKFDKTGKYAKVECPECHSLKKVQKIHNFSFSFANPDGTDLWRSSHDYRFKHNLPKVLKEREAAERASHVGATPYRKIDDISKGDTFGEVK
jgi:putative FmdB family regulatory protein